MFDILHNFTKRTEICDYRNQVHNPLAEHVCETSHNIAWDDSRIIITNNRYDQRLCSEA